MATRSWLESWRAAGRRLVAGDAERLWEMEQDDDIYCRSCQVQFALASAEMAVQAEAKAAHMASDDHKRGGV